MRWGAQSDENQKQIVQDLKRIGVSVQCLGRVGGGCPDLLLGYGGETYIVEIKTEKGKLSDRQKGWIEGWRGRKVLVARSSEEIIKHMMEGKVYE